MGNFQNRQYQICSGIVPGYRGKLPVQQFVPKEPTMILHYFGKAVILGLAAFFLAPTTVLAANEQVAARAAVEGSAVNYSLKSAASLGGIFDIALSVIAVIVSEGLTPGFAGTTEPSQTSRLR